MDRRELRGVGAEDGQDRADPRESLSSSTTGRWSWIWARHNVQWSTVAHVHCTYCVPKEIFGRDFAFVPRAQLLSFDEIARLARIASSSTRRERVLLAWEEH